MKKEKLPDGFPVANDDADARDYPCDNCGKHHVYFEGFMVDADGKDEDGDYESRSYGFCCQECAEEFARDNGLILCKSEETDMVATDYKFTLRDVSVCDAETQPEDVTPETKPEDEHSEEAPTELNEVEMFGEEKPTCYEKKATECWKHVVKTAQEISQAASKIVVLQDQLKDAKKEYDALVNRQNSYILTNGDSIQATFDDMDSIPEPTITKDSEPAEPDNSWRSLPCDGKLPVKLTDKQWDAVRSAFPTLGDLQDWLSRDRREKIPGVSQTVYDKLVDALNDYVAVWQQEHNADKQTTEENDNV